MIKNNDSRNITEAWDLTDAEWERFYRGAGVATIVIDDKATILACVYHEMEDDEAPMSGIEGRQVVGMMSSSQFCPYEPIEKRPEEEPRSV